MVDNTALKEFISTESIFDTALVEQTEYILPNYDETPFLSPSNKKVQQQNKTTKATSIIRTHYSRKIYEKLTWLSENFESTVEALPIWQELLEVLFDFKDNNFEDPFSAFISGLYDGLVNNDSWINLISSDFKVILKLIKSLNNNKNLDYDKIDKALMDLEDIGLDTTPFG